MDSRLRGNILEPITFDDNAQAAKFIQTHVCSMCRGRMVANYAPERKWIIRCPECDADAYEHNVTTPYTIELIVSKEHEMRIISRERRQVDPDELLKGLGF